VRAVTRPWTAPAARCTGGLAAVGLAAVAGFVAVPGGPGAPNALVAAVAALAAVVLAMHLGAAGSVLTTACCLAALAVAVALAVLVTRASPQVIGAALAATAIGVLHGAGRLAIALTRLAPWPMQSSNHPEGKVIRAQHVLTGLVVASAAAAAAGALGTATGTHGDTGARFGGVAFGAVIGAALLLRARAHTDQAQIAALVGGGIAALGGSLVAAAATVPQHPLWLCATAGAASGIALHLGNRPALSPVTWRALELLEYPVLAAVAPLACWACGSYDAIRGLGLA
jgi:type VII secretion integral membrane protein EccD